MGCGKMKGISQSTRKLISIEMTCICGCYKKGRTNAAKIFMVFVRPFSVYE
jgi:hypothetical protein